MKRTRRQFAELRYTAMDELVQGVKLAAVARKHRVAPSTLRRWRGQIIVRPERATSEADDERAARAWREAPTPTRAFAAFVKFVDGDPDHWGWEVDLALDQPERTITLVSRPDARRFVVTEKNDALRWLQGHLRVEGGDNLLRDLRVSLATWVMPIPWRWTVDLVRARAKTGPIGFLGDLDADGLLAFAALRAGGIEFLLEGSGGPKLDVRWLGLDDRALRSLRRSGIGSRHDSGAAPWIERELWGVVKRLVPDVTKLHGPKSVALLDAGRVIDNAIPFTLASAAYGKLVQKRIRALAER